MRSVWPDERRCGILPAVVTRRYGMNPPCTHYYQHSAMLILRTQTDLNTLRPCKLIALMTFGSEAQRQVIYGQGHVLRQVWCA